MLGNSAAGSGRIQKYVNRMYDNISTYEYMVELLYMYHWSKTTNVVLYYLKLDLPGKHVREFPTIKSRLHSIIVQLGLLRL